MYMYVCVVYIYIFVDTLRAFWLDSFYFVAMVRLSYDTMWCWASF